MQQNPSPVFPILRRLVVSPLNAPWALSLLFLFLFASISLSPTILLPPSFTGILFTISYLSVFVFLGPTFLINSFYGCNYCSNYRRYLKLLLIFLVFTWLGCSWRYKIRVIVSFLWLLFVYCVIWNRGVVDIIADLSSCSVAPLSCEERLIPFASVTIASGYFLFFPFWSKRLELGILRAYTIWAIWIQSCLVRARFMLLRRLL